MSDEIKTNNEPTPQKRSRGRPPGKSKVVLTKKIELPKLSITVSDPPADPSISMAVIPSNITPPPAVLPMEPQFDTYNENRGHLTICHPQPLSEIMAMRTTMCPVCGQQLDNTAKEVTAPGLRDVKVFICSGCNIV